MQIIDSDKIRCDNDTACCGLAVLACLLFIVPCCPGSARVPSRKNESHQTLINATLRLLLLRWFASLSWHRFPTLGLTAGNFNTQMHIVWSQCHQVNSDVQCYKTHRRTKWEGGTNCCITLLMQLRPPAQRLLRKCPEGRLFATVAFCYFAMNLRVGGKKAYVRVSLTVSCT